MSHTPGPWSYMRNPGNTRWIIDSKPAHAIACTAGYEPDNEANARLIAAAPSLLEALELIDASWTDIFPDGPQGNYGAVEVADEHKVLWANTRAAIALARGEAVK